MDDEAKKSRKFINRKERVVHILKRLKFQSRETVVTQMMCIMWIWFWITATTTDNIKIQMEWNFGVHTVTNGKTVTNTKTKH